MKSVLIVDDEPLLRRELREAFEHAGYAVAEASNGEDALDVMATMHPTVVITDIFMPKCDGIELIMTIKKRGNGAKIVAISSGGRLGFPNYPGLATKLGAELAYEKPLEIKRMLQDLDRLTAAADVKAEPSLHE